MNTYKRLSVIFVFLLVSLAFTNVDSAVTKADQKPGKSAHVPDVLILEVMPGITLEDNPGGGKDHKFTTNSPALDEALTSIGVQSLKSLFPPGQLKKELPANLSRIYRLKLKPNTDIEAAVAALSSVPDIVFAEPDYIAVSTELPSSVKILTINDPEYPANQWGMTKINIEGAWDDTFGSPTVTIAIIDSGIDLLHVDLAGNLWLNPGEIAGNGLDDDSNGYVDDVKGWNVLAGSNDISDTTGHGTLVAGVAAAVGGNAQGIVGVCPQCTIMTVKVTDSTTANYSDIAVGVLYAAQKGAEVINISLGGYSNSNMLSNAINTAVNTYGAVIVAGAGNDDLSTPFYPAYYANVLAVAGTQSNDTKVPTSNYGAWVDVSAPGINIRTTALGGGWADNSGTSFASPFAAGLAGLLRTLHPTWGQATIRSQIVHTTANIDSLNPTYAGKMGSGRLNASTAMDNPHPLLSMTGYGVNGTPDGNPLLGKTAQMTVTLSNDWWNATGVTATLSTTDTINVTIVNGSVSYGNIPAATSKTNTTPFTFSVASGAGKNHPIPFTLAVTDTTGYSNSFDFTVTTESGVVTKYGTLPGDQTWTSDKTYRITGSVNVPTGTTLTIQPGTTIKFDSGFALNIRGTLIADGTADLPIQFISNTAETWDKIFFDDSSVDAVADGSGVYTSGSILRHVKIEDSTGGIDCTISTPYLSHISLDGGGIICSLGATPVWFLDNEIVGNTSFTGAGNAFRNTVSGGLSISGASIAENNTVSGILSLGSGSARRNTVNGLSIGGSGGTLENNKVSSGNVSLGNSFTVMGNTINGKLTTGTNAVVDHNTVSNGITVGGSSAVTWNNVENASGTGLAAGSNVTAQYNRLIGNAIGMTATTGLIEHNLIANNTGVGLQVGAATVQYNTLTGNHGNSIVVQTGNPLTIQYNNLEGNSGSYDLFINIPYNGGDIISSENNWWGTTDTTVVDTRIWDYWEDDTKGEVNYLPILTEPDQTAPAYVRNVTVLPDTTLGIQTGTFEVQLSRPMDINITPSMSFERLAGFSWTTRTNMPTKRRQLGVVAVNNGKIYAIGGTSDVFLSTVEEYDPVTDIWRTRANMPTARGDIGVAASSNGKIHAIGGVGFDGIRLTTVEEYDPVTDTWVIRASMPTGRSGLGVVTAKNGKIYAIGGLDSQYKYIGTVEEYDPITNTWSTRASMPTARAFLGIVASSNGKIYAIGGVGISSANLQTVEQYDPLTDTWSTRESMSMGRNSFAVVEGTNRKLYAFGGFRGGMYLNTMEEYDTINNIWVTRTSMPHSRVSFGAASGRNGKIYVIGGANQVSYAVNWVDELTLTFERTNFYNYRWLSETQFESSYDITSAIPKDTYQVSVNGAFDQDGMKIAPNIDTTLTVDYAGSITDLTPPTKPVVVAYTSSGNLTSISASWTSSDAQSPITKYRYAIGTTPGGRDVVDWTYIDNPSMTHTGLSLSPGVTYYISAGARNEGGLWSESGVSNGVKNGISTSTFLSTGSQDGWILESFENSTLGGTINAIGTTFYVGDEVGDKQYRSILSFNTAILPNTAVIRKVTLKFKAQSITGVNPFTTHGNLLVDVYKGAFSASPTLQLTDFQALPSKASIGIIPKTPVSGWYTKVWTSGIFPYINKLTVTQFRLRFTKDDNDDGNADYMKFFSGNYGTATARPTLIIEYYVP